MIFLFFCTFENSYIHQTFYWWSIWNFGNVLPFFSDWFFNIVRRLPNRVFLVLVLWRLNISSTLCMYFSWDRHMFLQILIPSICLSGPKSFISISSTNCCLTLVDIIYAKACNLYTITIKWYKIHQGFW